MIVKIEVIEHKGEPVAYFVGNREILAKLAQDVAAIGTQRPVVTQKEHHGKVHKFYTYNISSNEFVKLLGVEPPKVGDSLKMTCYHPDIMKQVDPTVGKVVELDGNICVFENDKGERDSFIWFFSASWEFAKYFEWG